jgi:Uma2 family endonuclease
MAITEHTSSSRAAQGDRRRFVRPPEPVHFPVSEEMPETNRHLELRTALYLILKRELASRATIGSDQFVYYDPTTARKKLAPDAFVKLGLPHAPFRCWKTWLHGAPDVAVEVVSDSDEGDEAWETKAERYRSAGIGEVVRFDPDDAERPLRVWNHVDGDLVERERPEDGVFECASLGLYWVVVPHPAYVRILRLSRDRAGRDLLPTPDEAEMAAERARREEAQARKEETRARQEEARARQEEARARQEEARARRAAEQARDQAEAERERLARENAELRRLLEASSTTPRAAKPVRSRAGKKTAIAPSKRGRKS